ncbi:MAG TPA: ferritin-like domain-containing protein [Thermoleophilaceae bacterium]|nr:ferritin-like domain-containing protein [Thermoleophilaceae bacterium]
MRARLTRRAALGTAAALALGSCGGGDDPPAGAGAAPGSGAGLLGSLLAFELAVTAAYEACFDVLRGDALRWTREIHEDERRHADFLERLIRDLGGTPPRSKSREEYARSFPRLPDATAALRFMQDLEEREVRGFLDALADLPDPELRASVAELAVAEGAHLAAVHVLRREPAAQDPFVTGAL